MMTVGATRSCRSEFHVKEEAGSQFFKFFYGTLFPMEAFLVKSIFVCKIPLGTQNLMQKPYFAAG